MNALLIAAGAVALFTTVGHFAIGTKLYLKEEKVKEEKVSGPNGIKLLRISLCRKGLA